MARTGERDYLAGTLAVIGWLVIFIGAVQAVFTYINEQAVVFQPDYSGVVAWALLALVGLFVLVVSRLARRLNR